MAYDGDEIADAMVTLLAAVDGVENVHPRVRMIDDFEQFYTLFSEAPPGGATDTRRRLNFWWVTRDQTDEVFGHQQVAGSEQNWRVFGAIGAVDTDADATTPGEGSEEEMRRVWDRIRAAVRGNGGSRFLVQNAERQVMTLSLRIVVEHGWIGNQAAHLFRCDWRVRVRPGS